jgi:hypothetical protein
MPYNFVFTDIQLGIYCHTTSYLQTYNSVFTDIQLWDIQTVYTTLDVHCPAVFTSQDDQCLHIYLSTIKLILYIRAIRACTIHSY